MEPEWHQDIKSIQPRQLPQFEVAGPQIDDAYRQSAARLVVTRAGLGITALLVLIALALIPKAVRSTKSDFGKISYNQEDFFTGKVLIRLQSVHRQAKIDGLLFDTKAGKTTAGEGVGFLGDSNPDPTAGRSVPLEFVILNITVVNNSNQDYLVNPHAFALTTPLRTYRTAMETRLVDRSLKNGELAPGEKRSGAVVFKIPKDTGLTALEIMGTGGPITRITL